ncbi:hypothetical protein JI739_00805 [Ramlibacter sp. AW1]|uniref:Uncharacterized protein n=1 Tax=Ramlibacter aurantiacus TaxID=2801330 RepID=A0A936ZQK0_9BURK|nr:hypothetical protein [Ramlibacter aurantiacus]MBL0418874.1 hypothetical protein [Ramlibacter aurantiacus]
MAVPWGVLVSTLPTLIDSAGKLFKKADATARLPEVRGSDDASVRAIAARLEALEDLQADQAQLLKQAIEQLQQMAVKSAAAERRAWVAIVIAVVSAGIAAAAWLVG